MKCEYIGKSKEHDYREAYITYSGHEEKKFGELYDLLLKKGWKLECEEECATVNVQNKDEYEIFYSDYKEAKEMIDCSTCSGCAHVFVYKGDNIENKSKQYCGIDGEEIVSTTLRCDAYSVGECDKIKKGIW